MVLSPCFLLCVHFHSVHINNYLRVFTFILLQPLLDEYVLQHFGVVIYLFDYLVAGVRVALHLWPRRKTPLVSSLLDVFIDVGRGLTCVRLLNSGAVYAVHVCVAVDGSVVEVTLVGVDHR